MKLNRSSLLTVALCLLSVLVAGCGDSAAVQRDQRKFYDDYERSTEALIQMRGQVVGVDLNSPDRAVSKMAIDMQEEAIADIVKRCKAKYGKHPAQFSHLPPLPR